MTLLTVIQDACLELKVPKPSTVIGNTDANTVLMLALAHRAGKELRSKYDWTRLTKEYTFSTSNGTAAYALPADIDYEQFQTHWDRTNFWPLRGPESPSEWQQRKSGISTVLPRMGFRIKGYTDTTFYLEPTPSSTATLVFEYQTRNWILPVTWTASTVFLAESYCSYNGNIYYTSAGGTTGSTAPTHTSSSSSDGGVTWVYQSGVYERFLADTDVSQIPEEVLILDLKWRWKQASRFEFEDLKQEAKEAADRAYSSQRSAQEISITARRRSTLIQWDSIPDGNYGS